MTYSCLSQCAYHVCVQVQAVELPQASLCCSVHLPHATLHCLCRNPILPYITLPLWYLYSLLPYLHTTYNYLRRILYKSFISINNHYCNSCYTCTYTKCKSYKYNVCHCRNTCSIFVVSTFTTKCNITEHTCIILVQLMLVYIFMYEAIYTTCLMATHTSCDCYQ